MQPRGLRRIRNAAALVLLFLIGAGAAAPVSAGDCELSITGNDQIQYDQAELVIPADCTTVTVKLEHVGSMSVDQMGHNWVLTRTADFKSVAQAGMRAGRAHEYLPPGDERVIAHTGLVGGGATDSVTFEKVLLEAGADYTFFCSFPGHYGIMNGRIVVE